MKNWILALVIIVAAASIFNGYLYLQQSSGSTNLQSQIASLQSDVSSLRNNVSSLQNTTQALSQSRAPSNTPAAVSSPTPLTVPQLPPQPLGAVSDVVKIIEPCVVRIDVSGPGFQGSGSGSIIRNTGYVLTNQHVIDQANSITVTAMNGDKFTGSVHSSDANIDIAILKLNSSRTDLPSVTLGSMSDLVVGQEVVAAGFPLGTNLPGPASFTRGIISAIRTVGGQRFIQTDVTINPGSSGGCLADLNGKLLGITSAAILPTGVDAEGIGLAIPADIIRNYVQTNLK
jgi:serine protease Do